MQLVLYTSKLISNIKVGNLILHLLKIKIYLLILIEWKKKVCFNIVWHCESQKITADKVIC